MYTQGIEAARCGRTDEDNASQIASRGDSQHGFVVALIFFSLLNPSIIDSKDEIKEKEQLNEQEHNGRHACDVAVKENHVVREQKRECVEYKPEPKLDSWAARHQKLSSSIACMFDVEKDERHEPEEQLHTTVGYLRVNTTGLLTVATIAGSPVLGMSDCVYKLFSRGRCARNCPG